VDLAKYRRDKNMGRAEMVRHLSQHMKGPVLTEEFLDEFERGVGNEYRARAIIKAAENAFPDIKGKIILEDRRRKLPKNLITVAKGMAVIAFLAVTLTLFRNWGDTPIFGYANEYLTLLTLIFATIAAIYAFFRKW
jgi:hypothetical protein